MKLSSLVTALWTVSIVKGSTNIRKPSLRNGQRVSGHTTPLGGSHPKQIQDEVTRALDEDSPQATDTASSEGVPTMSPTLGPSEFPTLVPSVVPSATPSSLLGATDTIPQIDESGEFPTLAPSAFPSDSPSGQPTIGMILGATETIEAPTEDFPVYTVCEDIRYCFRGAACVESLQVTDNYICECDAFPVDGPTIYRGFRCEYLHATSICNPNARTHFCTNDGECPEFSGSWPFTGCTCPEGYEGAHCQYWVGIEPSASPSEYPTLEPSLYPTELAGAGFGSEMPSGAPSTVGNGAESVEGELIFPAEDTYPTLKPSTSPGPSLEPSLPPSQIPDGN